jgi:hypothetical protein
MGEAICVLKCDLLCGCIQLALPPGGDVVHFGLMDTYVPGGSGM